MASPSPRTSSRSDPAGTRPLYVGLTGGIGSGKSTVADLLAAAGAAIIDTDAIAHALTAPGGAAIEPIRAAFGDAYIDPAGALDRARMRSIVFADATAKQRLEHILHPLIRTETVSAAARVGEACYVVFVVPLLVESGSWADRVDRVLVVDCSLETQVARVTRRAGLDEPTARAIAARQADRATRLDAADDVVVNEGTVADLVPRVAQLHARYLELARARDGLAPRH